MLGTEALRALEIIVEAARALPPSSRQPFYAMRVVASHRLVLHHAGVPHGFEGLYPADVEELAEAGYIRLSVTRNTWQWDIRPSGFEAYDAHKLGAAEPLVSLERDALTLLDRAGFAKRHSAAHDTLSRATNLVWADDSDRNVTVVGHLCREALQEFASSMLSLYPAPDAPTDQSKTVARLRAAVRAAKSSDAVEEVLARMIEYCGAVADLAVRQEHGAKREGDPLYHEDSRRLVFHCLFIMTEVDRTASHYAVRRLATR